jgi:3-hydroxyacyl-CoA dehydrogenase
MASDIRKVGVIGIGLMGSGIAQVAATRGFETVVVDVTSEILERGMGRIRDRPAFQLPKKSGRFLNSALQPIAASYCDVTSSSRPLSRMKKLRES